MERDLRKKVTVLGGGIAGIEAGYNMKKKNNEEGNYGF